MGGTEWSSGICNKCCQDKCLWACVCPCVIFGENIKMMEQWEVPMKEMDMISCYGAFPKSSCGFWIYAIGCFSSLINAGVNTNSCLAFVNVLEILPVILHTRLRTSLREKYDIKPDCCCCGECGGMCEDLCCATFCYSCALTQENFELKEKKRISDLEKAGRTQTLMPAIENSFLISIDTRN